MELDKKLQLYFFDPKKDEEKYSQLFYKLSDQNTYVGYAPLYLLRRHILALSGKLFKYNELKQPIYHVPYFSAVLLANISITGLIELTNCYNPAAPKKDQYDFTGFYEKYFGKNEIQLVGLRLLRNALEHNYFQLFTRVYKNNKNNTKNFYDVIMNHVKLSPPVPHESLKVAFKLEEIPTGLFVKGPELERECLAEKYALVRYKIDPFRFLDKLEVAINVIHKEIKSDTGLSKRFDESVTADNWMKVCL
jgi:hypothetical protein